MAINNQLIKKFAAEKVVKLALKYIERDPEKHFINLLDLFEKIAIKEDHQKNIAAVRRQYEEHPAMIRGYLRRLNQLAPSYKKGLLLNFFINSGLLGIPYQNKMAEELGIGVPWAILLDPTSSCNLNCIGCWAGKYNKENNLDFEIIDRILTEAKELGIYFVVLSGGEPTIYPQLFDIFAKHQDMGFLMFTNGTLIDDKMAEQMVEVGNITPTISIEGFSEATDGRRGKGVYNNIMDVMDILKEKGIMFGTSITITRDNAEEIFASDEFCNMLINKGASYLWSFHYIPIGNDPDLEMMITPEQRSLLARRIPDLRNRKPLFIVDFWNDGTYSGGCIAGGRRYFHINSCGDVEPCAFVHFAIDNIKDKSLVEVLKNPLFKAYQERQPFNDNLLLPCPIIDNPEQLREMVKETKAYPTHSGAETLLSGEVAKGLDQLSSKWSIVSREILAERRL